jgi:hypothetical protein
MEDNTIVEKIVVEPSHELTDLVRAIHKSKAQRIILTIYRTFRYFNKPY